MDSRIGLDYIVENADYTDKLAKALTCNNVVVKKQVFELLTALCVYNSDGYSRALQILESYKDFSSKRYRLKFIIDELSNKENPVDYKITLLAFVNCLIISTPQLKDRVRIRNEFIGLKLLTVLEDLRRYINADDNIKYNDLVIQLDVFHEQKENDEAQILDSPNDVDLNSHVDIFYAILRQVLETPQEIPFLSILQHLLRIDSKEAISDIIWDTAETLVHRATLLESKQDATRILRSPSIQNRLCCHNHRSIPDAVGGSRKQSLNAIHNSTLNGSHSPLSSPQPQLINSPQSFPSGSSPPPPPPPLPPVAPPMPSSNLCINKNEISAPPLPPPLVLPRKETSQLTDITDSSSNTKLPQQETPVPKIKMKTINWNKIPNNKIIGSNNVWSAVARNHEHSPMTDFDWTEMEGLFCQQIPPVTVPTCQASPKLGRRDFNDPHEKRRRELSEIVLLDGKRSLNVNIFLKQFRCTNENIIEIIKEGTHDDIGAEKLRGLLKILPEMDELEMLKAFDGDKTKLATAEKFLLQLITVSNYKLRIESMLLKEEFASNMSYLEPNINAMIVAGEDLMKNKSLQEVLYMVVCAGNFLNSGGYAGNAAGVKLNSLQKLADIRANKPGMNLIHYVAMQIEKKRKPLLKCISDISSNLEETTKTSVEQLHNEVQALDNRIQKIKKQVELLSTEDEIKDQMRDFLKMAEQEIKALQHDLRVLESVRKSLAEFFCEDSETFKIEECFKIFYGFCSKFKQAIVENERRRIHEEQANARRKQREEQLKKKSIINAESIRAAGNIISDNQIMNFLLNDMQPNTIQIKCSDKDSKNRKIGLNASSVVSEDDSPSIINSPIINRKRLGSYSGDSAGLVTSKEETCSPDITPNGSLRRRRSRITSEEEESALIDFLRSAEQEHAKDRKLWGSLDRSWARKVRGGKKRPDVLNTDFTNDRERAASPSPITENKSLLPFNEEETRPKGWRQKIEAWLQENEKEEKQNLEKLQKTQRRLYGSRRSLENDSENEGRDYSNSCSTPESASSKSRKDFIGEYQDQLPVYQRVYTDLKPIINTDNSSITSFIADPQSRTEAKELQSSAGKNMETDTRKLYPLKTRVNADQPTTLEAIKEEEKKSRNSLILDQSSNICSRTDSHKNRVNTSSQQPVSRSSNLYEESKISINEQQSLPPFAPRKIIKRTDTEVIDKIDIDSDNIETPPATRRILKYSRAPDKTRNPSNNSQKLSFEEEILGDGQFDRFSSARRTRRYRKSLDDDTLKPSEIEKHASQSTQLKPSNIVTENPENKDTHVRSWYDKLSELKYIDENDDDSPDLLSTKINDTVNNEELFDKKNDMTTKNRIPVLQDRYTRKNRLYSTLPHSFKSGIESKATTLIKNKPDDDTVQTDSSRESKIGAVIRPTSIFGLETKTRSLTPTKGRLEHDLNDEGFEETQSLISDSLSQTTSSGYNNDNDSLDLLSSSLNSNSNCSKTMLFNRTDSSGSGDVSGYESKTDVLNKRTHSSIPQKGKTSLLPRRSNSFRISSIPKLTNSINESNKLSKSPNSNIPQIIINKSGNNLISSNEALNNAKKPLYVKMPSKIPQASSYSINLSNEIKKSPSKSSLKGSRSSLSTISSCNSISTVKNNKSTPKFDNYTKVIKSIASNLQKSSNKSSNNRNKPNYATAIPIKNNKNVVTNNNFSNLDNAIRRNSSFISNMGSKENSLLESTTDSPHRYYNSCQSFMRPTASSSARDMAEIKPKLIVRTPFK